MLKPIEVALQLAAASRGAPDAPTADRAVAAILADLRRQLSAPPPAGEPPPMIRTWSPAGPRRGEHPTETAARLSARIEEIGLARRYGDVVDVRRMIELTIDELRQVAIEARPTSIG
jgi:hypothetical protein